MPSSTGASACRGVFLFLWDPTALHLPSTGHRKPVMTYCSNSENDTEIKRWHRNSCWLCRDWKTAPRNRVQTVSFYFYTQKSIPNFQRYFVSGLLFSFHNSQCSPRSLNVIMQRGRTGTISPLKPLYWHTCKTKINLLPASYTPHASFCLQLFIIISFYFQLIRRKSFYFSHFAGSWNSPNEGSRAEMQLSHPSAKIPANIRCCYDSEL